MIDKEEEQYLLKLHKEILNIMDVINAICNENELKYYIVGGTLLGAVRHQGFIPWDDDLDIAMPRTDFEKFIKICKNKLPLPYKLQWITTNKQYWLPYAKIENGNTVFSEVCNLNKNQTMGIFVDIFPLDDVSKYSKVIDKRKWLINKMETMICLQFGNDSKGLKKKFANCFTIEQLNKMITKLMSCTNNTKNKFYMNFGSQYSAYKQTIKKEWYGEGKMLLFEGRYFCAPSKYQDVLKSIYGENYMTLPPIEKRKTHYPNYVKFSDGLEMNFEVPEIRLKVEDTE